MAPTKIEVLLSRLCVDPSLTFGKKMVRIPVVHLWFLLSIMAAQAQEKTPVALETPHGTVAWKEVPSEKGGQVASLLREMTTEELRALKKDADQAPAFLNRYAPAQEEGSHPLDKFDAAFEGWLNSRDQKKESADRVVRILGSAYGFYCIQNLGMRWAWIKDEFGEDIALVREHPTSRSFPFTSIRYRIEDKKTDFIYALYASLAHLIAEAADEKKPDQPPEPKPDLSPRASSSTSK